MDTDKRVAPPIPFVYCFGLQNLALCVAEQLKTNSICDATRLSVSIVHSTAHLKPTSDCCFWAQRTQIKWYRFGLDENYTGSKRNYSFWTFKVQKNKKSWKQTTEGLMLILSYFPTVCVDNSVLL